MLLQKNLCNGENTSLTTRRNQKFEGSRKMMIDNINTLFIITYWTRCNTKTLICKMALHHLVGAIGNRFRTG